MAALLRRTLYLLWPHGLTFSVAYLIVAYQWEAYFNLSYAAWGVIEGFMIAVLASGSLLFALKEHPQPNQWDRLIQGLVVLVVCYGVIRYGMQGYTLLSKISWSYKAAYIIQNTLLHYGTPVLVVSLVLGSYGYGLGTTDEKEFDDNPHGNACFASSRELGQYHHQEGLPLGKIPLGFKGHGAGLVQKIKAAKPGSLLKLNPTHAIVVAPSGAGKGVGFVVPTLLEYDGPVIVTDVKAAENFHITAQQRKNLGRPVYAFDPYGLTDTQTATINIFDYLDPSSATLVEDVNVLTSVLRPIPKEDSDNAKYFAEQGMAIIQCLILYVLTGGFPQEQRNLITVYELLCRDSEELKELLTEIYHRQDLCDGIPSRLSASFLSTDHRELSGILNSARIELRFLDTPLMRKATCSSTCSLSKILDNEADLFICIPSEALETQDRLIRLILSMVFILLQRRRKKPEKSILMVLDEMPLLGRLQQIEKALVLGRGYGVKIFGITQSIEMLKTVYRHKWETMLSSNLTVFFGTSDKQTSDYVSAMTGSTTTRYESKSRGRSHQGSLFLEGKTSHNDNQSVAVVARNLLTSDEVRLLGDDIVVAFMAGKKPMVLKKVKYYQEKAWQGKYANNPLEGIK
jgi:Type IV secretory pathway, VirD4 components